MRDHALIQRGRIMHVVIHSIETFSIKSTDTKHFDSAAGRWRLFFEIDLPRLSMFAFRLSVPAYLPLE